jgi:hypothetical protein
MPPGRCVTDALQRTKHATSSIHEGVVSLEMLWQNVDSIARTNSGHHSPQISYHLAPLRSDLSLLTTTLTLEPSLMMVMSHGQEPRLRRHFLILDLQAYRTCWTMIGVLPVITISSCITNISIACIHVSYHAGS